MKRKYLHVGKRERATCAGNCRHVSGSVQKYSVQYKGYNLIGVTTVEGGVTRGTAALVYSGIHTCLSSGYVQVYWLGVLYPHIQHVHAEAGRTGLHKLVTPVNIKIVKNPCSPIPYNEEIEEDKFCRTIGIYRVKYIELLSINLWNWIL
jgi:hypothetical protein